MGDAFPETIHRFTLALRIRCPRYRVLNDMKKVLITGGAGFVGRHFCHALLKQGHQVTCVDSVVPMTGGICPLEMAGWPLYDPTDYDNFIFIKQDCRTFFGECGDTDFDEVFHLAAIVGGREMIENNPLAVAEDLGIDAMMWQWSTRTRPGKIVCFSSSAAYPIKYQSRDSYRLLTEDMIDFSSDLGMPDLSYGWSKLTHEYLAKLAYAKHGIRSVTYRPFSGYGEDQDMTYPFPSICRRVLEKKSQNQVKVWGTGDQMRDFIHISDCVSGVLASMTSINDGSAVNLSTGIFTSFKDFVRTAADIVGYSPEVTGTSDTPEGVFARGGDTGKQASLGISHRVPFRAGIKAGIEFIDRKRMEE